MKFRIAVVAVFILAATHAQAWTIQSELLGTFRICSLSTCEGQDRGVSFVKACKREMTSIRGFLAVIPRSERGETCVCPCIGDYLWRMP